MDIDNLVKMANQIGRFFEPWPDQAAACGEVANHLRRFWDPRRRTALIDHVGAGAAGSDVAPLVAQAVATLALDEPRVRALRASTASGRDSAARARAAGAGAAPDV